MRVVFPDTLMFIAVGLLLDRQLCFIVLHAYPSATARVYVSIHGHIALQCHLESKLGHLDLCPEGCSVLSESLCSHGNLKDDLYCISEECHGEFDSRGV